MQLCPTRDLGTCFPFNPVCPVFSALAQSFHQLRNPTPEKAMVGIQRRIHFYATTVYDPAGMVLPPNQVMDEVARLVSNGDWEREISDEKSQGLLCRRRDGNFLEGAFWFDKHDHFPDVGDGPASEPLDTQGKPLRYPTHFVWWDLTGYREMRGVPRKLAGGLLAMEFNIDAPRVGGFSQFIYEKSGQALRVDIVPVVEPGALDRLKQTRVIKSFRVKVKDPNLSQQAGLAGSLGGLFILPEVHGFESLEWEIRPKPRSHMQILRKADSKLRSFAAAGASFDVRIRFDDGVELPLEEAPVLHLAKDIPRGNDGHARSVNPDAMLQEIHNAYQAKLDALRGFFGRHIE